MLWLGKRPKAALVYAAAMTAMFGGAMAQGQTISVFNRVGQNLAYCGPFGGIGPLVDHDFTTAADVHDTISISDPGPPFSSAVATFDSTWSPGTGISITIAGRSHRGVPQGGVSAAADGRDTWDFTVDAPTCFAFRVSMRADSTRTPDQTQSYYFSGPNIVPAPGTPADALVGSFQAPGSRERTATGMLMPGTYRLNVNGRADASTFPYDASYEHTVSLTIGSTAVLTGPVSAGSCPSGSASFSVSAAGGGPFAYQWLVESPAGSGAYVDLTPGTFFEPSSGLTFDVTGETTPMLGVSNLELGTHPEAIRFAVRVTGGCGSATSEPADWTICTGDLNCDDIIDFADYLEFLTLFDAQDPRVDYNRDGSVDFADYLEFLNRFDLGC